MPSASAAAAAPAAAAPVEEVAAPKEKTVFNVNLTKIDAAQKAKAIREVKALMPGMNLVEVSCHADLETCWWKEGSCREVDGERQLGRRGKEENT